jgi:hypothetical protein
MKFEVMTISQEGYGATWGCSHFWKVPYTGVNDKPLLNKK